MPATKIPTLADARDMRAPPSSSANPLEACAAHLRHRRDSLTAAYRDCTLESVFQPIYSFAHQRAVGCEALLRARASNNATVSPLTLFASAATAADAVQLDRLCRMLHVANFNSMGNPDAWLFLNVDPATVVNGRRFSTFFSDLLEAYRLAPGRVVVEILETAIPSEAVLEQAIDYYKDLGCLVALDDFGAGHSNFERIWRLEPDIVKLDRNMITEASRRTVARRSLPGLVNLLHGVGCIVLAEGIETEDEALTAMDADIDLVQGYFFGHPRPVSAGPPPGGEACEYLHGRFRAVAAEQAAADEFALRPYLAAFERCAHRLAAGSPVEAAASEILGMKLTARLYQIGFDGRQLQANLQPPAAPAAADLRLTPLRNARGANWSHRPYFRGALEHRGKVHVSGPYLSLPDAMMCITLSIAFDSPTADSVLCVDLAWSRPFRG